MNVGISYAVDFEELPKEVKKLISETRLSVENGTLDFFEEAENNFDDENYFRALKNIDSIRKSLYKADLRLSCYLDRISKNANLPGRTKQ